MTDTLLMFIESVQKCSAVFSSQLPGVKRCNLMERFPQDDRFATNKLQASPPPGAYEVSRVSDGARSMSHSIICNHSNRRLGLVSEEKVELPNENFADV